ncbi:MAG: hypothetical protein FWC41_06505 [Firmicutes bacterium]|nr:hypothetical protein [Bacillota bacterium]
MKNIIILPFLIISFALNAQKKSDEYKKVDDKIVQYSGSLKDNAISELTKFINENFHAEIDKLRATFVWIASNFDYDAENMFAIKFYSEPQEVIGEMLKNKKGVCMHFAYFFNEIGNQLGIKTVVISGYTKQRGFVDYVPHVWCASLVDTTWYLFDPTWGSGYLQNNKFVKKLNNDYFRITPEKLINSHMPFDPLWQFLYYPISSQEFYESKTAINKSKPFFSYVDTLKVYENQTKIEQLISTNRRIEQNGVKNTLTFNQLQSNAREIEYYKSQSVVNDYNSAIYHYNKGIDKLNRFIDYRNKQFIPQKTEIEIREMVKSAENSLISSQNELQKISTTDISTINSINQLRTSIKEATLQVKEQNDFIDKYFSTKKIFRKSLFYKYTWFGVPLN